MPNFSIRPARDSDCWDLVGLVAGCWSEYPGCVLDVHGEVPELLALATHYQAIGGACWVAESGARAVGCAALAPGPAAAVVMLQKLYVAHAARNAGIGSPRRAVETEAVRRGAAAIELWSDTRFARAHRFYEARGYVRLDGTRELHDPEPQRGVPVPQALRRRLTIIRRR